MNYERIYGEFIADRINSQPRKPTYFEKHHMLPRSLGGADAAENLIRLTARDHYFAHCCLAKMHKGKMWSALFAIANMTKTKGAASYFLRGRMVSIARANAAQVRSVGMSKLWRSGEFKRVRVYKPHSQSVKDKIRAANVGKTMSQASIDKQKATRRQSSQVFEFVRMADGLVFKGLPVDFYRTYGLTQELTSCLTRGKIASAKGWMLSGGNPSSVRGRDPTIRLFVNVSGEIFEGTAYDFRTKYSLDAGVISNLIHGKNRVQSFKGWKHASQGWPRNPVYRDLLHRS